MNMCVARSGTGSRQGSSRSRAAGGNARQHVVSGAAGGGLQERRPGRHGQVWEEAQAVMRQRYSMYGRGGDSHHGCCAAILFLECGHCAHQRLTVAIVTAGSVNIQVFVRGEQDRQGAGLAIAYEASYRKVLRSLHMCTLAARRSHSFPIGYMRVQDVITCFLYIRETDSAHLVLSICCRRVAPSQSAKQHICVPQWMD